MVFVNGGEGVIICLCVVEVVFVDRGVGVVFVVCFVRWLFKIEMFEVVGYEIVMVWFIKW